MNSWIEKWMEGNTLCLYCHKEADLIPDRNACKDCFREMVKSYLASDGKNYYGYE